MGAVIGVSIRPGASAFTRMPDAIHVGDFSKGRTQAENITAVVQDILGHGNEKCMLPGTIEANSAKLSEQANGLLFTEAEVKGFIHLAEECGIDASAWAPESLKTFAG